LEKYLHSGINIVLDPASKEVNSHEFAKLLKDTLQVNLFIGGAYGFERDFIVKCNNAISFGKITLSHKLVKVVLLEQIFRGLTINNNHPYHK
jgi:23S rRNA (pseudouridine1915-N3)-methyltransferase